MTLTEITANKHFLQIAALLSVAVSPEWHKRHPEVLSVRTALDQMAKSIHSGATAWNRSDSLKVAFSQKFVLLLADITMADTHLRYSTDDAEWFFEVLFGDDPAPATVFAMLFAYATAQQRWYSAEQLAEQTDEVAGTWKNRAARSDVPAVKSGKTWLFPSLGLRAYGVELTDVEHTKTEKEETV